jgi:hypothetical protein
MILPANLLAKMCFEMAKVFESLGGNVQCVHRTQSAIARFARSLSRRSSVRAVVQ